MLNYKVSFDLVLWHNPKSLFNAESDLNIYIKCTICQQKSTKLNGSKNCYESLHYRFN